MTPKEACAVCINVAKGKRVILLYQGIEVEIVTDKILTEHYKNLSKAMDFNPYSGLYVSWNNKGVASYRICVKEVKTPTLIQCSINDLEVKKDEKQL